MERKSPTIRRARHRFARPANVFSELESLRNASRGWGFGRGDPPPSLFTRSSSWRGARASASRPRRAAPS